MITILVLGISGLHGSEFISRPLWMAVFLVIEASITLLLIYFLDASSRPSSRGVFGLIRWNPADIPVAVAVVPLLFLVVLLSGWMFQLTFPQYSTDGNPLLEKIRTPLDLAAFLVAGVYAGGVKEEVQRAFILLRFESSLGGIYTGLVLWSLIFGLGHYEQGWSSAFSAAALGLVFGWIFIWKRNLFTAISAHAIYDVTVLLIYWHYFRPWINP